MHRLFSSNLLNSFLVQTPSILTCEAARVQTFQDRSHAWPAHRIAVTPKQMSQAGLYYLGEKDRVKRWYCNGGLQNWARFDNPWFEHAKWFLTCEYLLQKKGPEFVVKIFNRFPSLDRPAAINPTGPLVANAPQNASRLRFFFERIPTNF